MRRQGSGGAAIIVEGFDPRGRVVVRPDAVLRGVQAGSGPTVLLLHAGGERRAVWSPVIDMLAADGFRCVAYDQRGHGESDGTLTTLEACAQDVAAMLRAEPPGPGCVIVGASLGGLAALAALADSQVRAKVAGLVLVDVVPDLEPSRVRRFLGTRAVLGTYSAAYSGLVEDVLAHVPHLRLSTMTLDLPVMLVRGEHGSAVDDDDFDRLRALAPHATAVRVTGAGHLVARDQPARLAEAVAACRAWPAQALLRDLRAAHVEHPGGALLAHLQRVHEYVVGWGASPRTSLAALCHALYGTDGFPRPLLTLDQRDRLRAAVGDEAERLVYMYAACDRGMTYPHLGATPLPLADRFTGDVTPLDGADLADFALLTIANELDVARTAPLPLETRQGIRALITALWVYAPDAAAQALADLGDRGDLGDPRGAQ